MADKALPTTPEFGTLAIIDAPPAEKNSSKLVPYVQQIIDAGEGKAGSLVFPSEKEATPYVRKLQDAAGELGKTARVKRVDNEDGTQTLVVTIVSKIVRARNTASASE